MTCGIPKRLGHIWIGPKPIPEQWMKTWPEKHPNWEYRIYDNEFLLKYPFRTRRLINEYFWRGEYAGVQDLMRYEILYEFGGFMADADSICLHPVDELLPRKGAYTVYDRAEKNSAGVSPFLAAEPGNPVLKSVIDHLVQMEPWDLLKPWRSTGNRFLIAKIHEIGIEKVNIWPSHYFIPWHHTDPSNRYAGPDKIYAEQQWGTTRHAYTIQNTEGKDKRTKGEIAADAERLRHKLAISMCPGSQPEKLERQNDHSLVQAADKNRDIWSTISRSDQWNFDLSDLNQTLSKALLDANLKPRIESEPFYCSRQNYDLSDSPLMVKADIVRSHLSSWMCRAQSIIQIGTGGGHMALLQKATNPDARILTIDPGGRFATEDSEKAEITARVAATWLHRRFGDSIDCLIGWPGSTVHNFFLKRPEYQADLLHINGITPGFLNGYGNAIKALKSDGIVLINHPNADELRRRILQLQMIGEVAAPIDYIDFGPLRGAYAVLQRQTS